MTLLAQVGKDLPERYYVGIDIGYREHVACAIGLRTFVQGDRLLAYLARCSSDPHTFLVLCEPTGGYYGASLYQTLLDQRYPTQLIENATTRHMRERIFGNLPKTDDIDARVMARIGYLHDAVGEEFTLRPLTLPKAEDAELLILCRNSWKVHTMVTRARNQFAQLMAVVFPELKFFFESSVSTLVPVSLMAKYASPAEIAAAPSQEIQDLLWKSKGYAHAKRVEELQSLAQNSSGLLPDPGRAWRLSWLTSFLLTNFQLLNELDKRVESVIEQHPGYAYLVGIPYSGPATLGIILATAGNVERFQNYRRYVAYTGYFAGLETSQTIDRTRMSRRGNRDLKRALFQIIAPMVWFERDTNPYKDLYERKLAEGRPWYRAMPFACAALARHIYHCLKFEQPYDASKAFGRQSSKIAADPALLDLQASLDERFEELQAQSSLQDG
jgi:transposase